MIQWKLELVEEFASTQHHQRNCMVGWVGENSKVGWDYRVVLPDIAQQLISPEKCCQHFLWALDEANTDNQKTNSHGEERKDSQKICEAILERSLGFTALDQHWDPVACHVLRKNRWRPGRRTILKAEPQCLNRTCREIRRFSRAQSVPPSLVQLRLLVVPHQSSFSWWTGVRGGVNC